MQMSSMVSAEMRECIENCLSCHAMCLSEAMQHCLKMGGQHVEESHFRIMMDCALMCQTSADFMLHGSQMHAQVCGVCAEACRRCAESCEGLEGMEECAQMCRRCAESCQKMAQAA